MIENKTEIQTLASELNALVGENGLAHVMKAFGLVLADHRVGWKEEDASACDADLLDYNGECARDLQVQSAFLAADARRLCDVMNEYCAEADRIS